MDLYAESEFRANPAGTTLDQFKMLDRELDARFKKIEKEIGDLKFFVNQLIKLNEEKRMISNLRGY